jgi:hypothetical protein
MFVVGAGLVLFHYVYGIFFHVGNSNVVAPFSGLLLTISTSVLCKYFLNRINGKSKDE